MRIGEVARACGISPKMIRYYVRTGLIPTPTRSVSGLRVYAEDEVRRLRFVHARHPSIVAPPLAAMGRAGATFTILRFWAGFWLLRRQCFCP